MSDATAHKLTLELCIARSLHTFKVCIFPAPLSKFGATTSRAEVHDTATFAHYPNFSMGVGTKSCASPVPKHSDNGVVAHDPMIKHYTLWHFCFDLISMVASVRDTNCQLPCGQCAGQ